MIDTPRFYQRTPYATMTTWFLFYLSGLCTGCVSPSTTGSANSHAANPHLAPHFAEPPGHIEGPRIWLGANEIVVNENRASWSPNEIITSQTSLPSFFSRIRALQASDDRLDAPGECIFNVAPEIPFHAAASAIWTAREAGCTGIWIRAGAEWLRLHEPTKARSGKPQDQTAPVMARQQIALHVTMANVQAEIFSISGSDDAADERLESILIKQVPRDAFGMTTLNNAINQDCTSAPRPCPSGVWLTGASEVAWNDAVNALAVVVGAHSTSNAPTNVTVLFDAHNGSSLERHVVKDVEPRLDSKIIQNVLRANFHQFATCYEQGLRRNPALQGFVLMKFVIGLDGRIVGWPQSIPQPANEQEQKPPMPDADVISCLVRKFKTTTTTLIFPFPPSGNVTVSYPMMFSPGQ